MTLDRITKLIALAGNNPSEEEARTAAYLACKAIRDQQLVLVEHNDPRLLLWSAPPRPRPQPAPQPPPRPAPPPRPQARQPDPRRRITARFPSVCKACRTTIAEGSFAWWRKDDGCLCGGCHDKGVA